MVDRYLEQARTGFATVDLDEDLKTAALENLAVWLREPYFEGYRPAIEAAIEDDRFRLLVDSFYRMLPFGTGGRRGAVGVGPNRINPYTVMTSVQGHCEFLARRFPGTSLHVVLAADVRRFEDLRGNYRTGTLGELAGLTSKDLSVLAARVYAANGVRVTMADPEEDTYVSTPELSFLIFDLGAHGGLNVSASHNPPDDNGAKFYNGAGGQEVPPYDEELVQVASQVREAKLVPYADAVARGLVSFLTPEQRQAYVELNVGLSLTRTARSARVAFSPLHGTGITTVAPVLESAGFDVVVTRSQATFDGAFPKVPHQVPNPEVPAAMEEVIETARRHGCDLAMATDPDADRLGVALPDDQGEWHCLTGNQIGVLMAYHVLATRQKAGLLRPSNFLVKTEVTTSLLTALAAAFGVRSIGHLLVGFKYIGDVLDNIERTGRWGDFQARPTDFLLAVEESHGVLASELIRDKDAANGALLIAEHASVCKEEGTTLYQRLLDIYKEFGYTGTALKSVVMEGAPGLANIRTIQQSMRENVPVRIAGRKVLEFMDRQDEEGVFGPIKSETDRESRNVLVFVLEGGVRLVLRPSGTEPKNKTYVEMSMPPVGKAATNEAVLAQMGQVNRELKEVLTRWEIEMLARIGIRYPRYATRFSDGLSLSSKLRFVRKVEPELRQMVSSRAEPGLAAERVQKLLREIGPVDMLRAGLEALSLGGSEEERALWERIVSHLE